MANKKVAAKHNNALEKIEARPKSSAAIEAKRKSDNALWGNDNVGEIVGNIESAKNSLATLATSISAEQSRIDNMRETIQETHALLEKMHEIKAKADSLDALELAIEETKATEAERQREVELERQREEDAHLYERDRTRKLENDEWVAEKKRRQGQLDAALTHQRQLAQQHAEELDKREAALEGSEQKIADLEARLKTDVDAAWAKATNAERARLTGEHTLAMAQEKNARALVEDRLASAQKRIAELEASNDKLRVKYDEAIDKVQDIATKAIAGAAEQKVVVQAGSSEVPASGRR